MKRVTALLAILFCAISSFAGAKDYSFLPAQTDAQKQFRSRLESGDAKGALKIWPDAMQGTSFGSSENGRAVHAYLLSQNGLPVTALKILIEGTYYNHLSAGVIGLWTPVWNSYVSELPPGLEMNASWKRLFSEREYHIRNAKQIPVYLRQAQSMPKDDLNKARLLWQIATFAPQFNDTASALKALTLLKECKQSLIGTDQIELATARVLYQKSDVDGALEHYNAIPKSSEFWLEALEERAWAHLRKNEYDKAVSDIATLLSPAFARLTGPEPYFLSELTSLKVCDYPKILKTSAKFKERHKERLFELGQLAKTGSNKALLPVMEAFDAQGFTIKAAGANSLYMPRDFMRDREFASNVKYRLQLMQESQTAKEVSAGDGDPEMARVLAGAQAEADQARARAIARLRVLAQEDLTDYKHNLDKLHIVEAEVIQRLYVDESLKGKRKLPPQVKDDNGTLHFPYSDKEVWLDELDHYKSNVKDCPALPSTKGASL